MKLRKILFGVVVTTTILIAGFIAFGSFEEWWTVSVKGQSSGYPWGRLNDNPWYYNTPALYTTIMLTEGILLLTSLALTVYFIFKRMKEKTFYCLLGIWVLMTLILINGYIQ